MLNEAINYLLLFLQFLVRQVWRPRPKTHHRLGQCSRLEFGVLWIT